MARNNKNYFIFQRMLERAKARREKLDNQLSNVGHDIKKRSPLKDANVILAQAPGMLTKTRCGLLQKVNKTFSHS